jgi:ferredoxin
VRARAVTRAPRAKREAGLLSCRARQPSNFLRRREMAQQLVFREGRCGECRRLFYVCGPCDCGQGYCGDACRERARTRIRRAANARHQKTEHGRLDHRDRMREYRARLRASVTDPGSRELAESAKSGPPNPENQRVAGAEVGEGRRDEELRQTDAAPADAAGNAVAGWAGLRCIGCQRAGELLRIRPGERAWRQRARHFPRGRGPPARRPE